jgi:hydrogenase-4 membrane subunit HyfE
LATNASQFPLARCSCGALAMLRRCAARLLLTRDTNRRDAIILGIVVVIERVFVVNFILWKRKKKMYGFLIFRAKT